MSFKSLQLSEPILQSLHEEGYTTPTPIQEQAIPLVLSGHDLLACAQTGTGKTAAFALPILNLLHNASNNAKKSSIKCLVVTPTRELAIQIADSFNTYGRYLNLKTTVIFGGVNQGPQVQNLRQGTDILVATPGRLLDLKNQGFVHLKEIDFFILDEADRMLDMGFIHDIKKLLTHIPPVRQTLFFSATMPPEIVQLANTILKNPVRIQVTPVSSTAETIQQHVFYVDRHNKNKLLIDIIDNNEVNSLLLFTRTKHGADKVAKFLVQNNISSEAIHGNKGQGARQTALSNFKKRITKVLVATDIAARGIDVDDLEFVINYDIPNVPETYVHRIGRTGRAGANGIALSFCDAEELAYITDIEKLISMKIPVVEEHPYPMMDFAPVIPSKPKSQNGNNRRRPSGNSGNNGYKKKKSTSW
jgi:ATP-dependent RNA helicase RhlE